MHPAGRPRRRASDLRSSTDCDRVLQQVGQRLRHLSAITIQLNVMRRKPCFEADLRPRALLQMDRLADQVGRRLALEHRRRHPGEGRELVDQPADVVDLVDDGVGARGERLGLASRSAADTCA